MKTKEELTEEELVHFFELNEKVKARAQAVAQFCTSIKSHESVEAILDHGDDVGILVWSNELGHEGYAFPKQYLFMSGSEIEADLNRRREEVERRVEMERNVRI